MKKTILATLAAALIASTAAPAFAAQGKGDGPRHGPRIERLMERFDANQDGAVMLDEVSAHRLAMFESADSDNSGSLSQDELKAFGDMRNQNREERRAEGKEMKDGDRDGKMAKHGDRDGKMGKHGERDGRMASKHDGKRHGEGKGRGEGRGEGRGDHRGGPGMERLDADKNGEISLEEFTSLDTKMFDRFDRNGDKKIDVTDFYRGNAADNN